MQTQAALRTTALTIALASSFLLAGCGEEGENTASEATTEPSWVLGSWSGELHQRGMRPFRVWAVVRSLHHSAANSVRYSGLDCRGTWKPLGGGAEAFRFRETITSGRSEACKGVGIVHLRRGEGGLRYRFTGGGVESRGLLRSG